MSTGVIIQARMNSSRLCGKVLKDIMGKPALQRVIERAAQIRGISRVVVATWSDNSNLPIVKLVTGLGYDCFSFWDPESSEDDVLDRYYAAASRYGFDTIVRVTADCPLLDPAVSNRVVERFHAGKYDYYSNTRLLSFPDGLDTEIFTIDALSEAFHNAGDKYDREHVTPYLWKNSDKFRLGQLVQHVNESHHRMTLDTADDLEYIRRVYEDLGEDFSTKDVLNLDYFHTLTRKPV